MNQEEKRANFKRIATKRTNKIIDDISNLKNLAFNTSFYSYEESQIKAIFEAIDKELNKAKKAFKKPNKRQKNEFHL